MVDESQVSMLHDVLAHPRRRTAIDVLESTGGRLAISDLATDIAVREGVDADDEEFGEFAQQIHTDLYHRHVGKLERASLVEYDPESNVVQYNGHPHLVREEQEWDVVEPERGKV